MELSGQFRRRQLPGYGGLSAELEEAAKPFHLRIEGPMDAEEREKQMLCLKGLREEVDRRGIHVELVADEWCNTLEDVKYFADNKAGHMAQIKTPDLGGINNIVKLFFTARKRDLALIREEPCNEDRPFRPGMRKLCYGYKAGPDPGKAGHGC